MSVVEFPDRDDIYTNKSLEFTPLGLSQLWSDAARDGPVQTLSSGVATWRGFVTIRQFGVGEEEDIAEISHLVDQLQGGLKPFLLPVTQIFTRYDPDTRFPSHDERGSNFVQYVSRQHESSTVAQIGLEDRITLSHTASGGDGLKAGDHFSLQSGDDYYGMYRCTTNQVGTDVTVQPAPPTLSMIGLSGLFVRVRTCKLRAYLFPAEPIPIRINGPVLQPITLNFREGYE